MTESELHLRMLFPDAPWTQALQEGAVAARGLSWESRSDVALAPERFVVAATGEFDIGENGVRRVALDVLAGKPANGIPVFLWP
jgi:hypothetical protein